jgi:hypothetical protein
VAEARGQFGNLEEVCHCKPVLEDIVEDSRLRGQSVCYSEM